MAEPTRGLEMKCQLIGVGVFLFFRRCATWPRASGTAIFLVLRAAPCFLSPVSFF